MATVLTEHGELTLAAVDGLWLSASDAERVTGWTLKPEGMCQDDVCVPMPTRDGRVDVVLAVAVRVRQPDAGRAGLEALDGPGIREDPDPGSLQPGADGYGNVLVFAH